MWSYRALIFDFLETKIRISQHPPECRSGPNLAAFIARWTGPIKVPNEIVTGAGTYLRIENQAWVSQRRLHTYPPWRNNARGTCHLIPSQSRDAMKRPGTTARSQFFSISLIWLLTDLPQRLRQQNHSCNLGV